MSFHNDANGAGRIAWGRDQPKPPQPLYAAAFVVAGGSLLGGAGVGFTAGIVRFGKPGIVKLLIGAIVAQLLQCIGERIAQGRDNARVYLKEHPDLFDELEKKIREELLSHPNEIPMDMEEPVDDEDEDDENLDDEEFEL